MSVNSLKGIKVFAKIALNPSLTCVLGKNTYIFPQNKMNLFVLSGHGSESFAAFLNGVRLQKTTRQ